MDLDELFERKDHRRRERWYDGRRDGASRPSHDDHRRGRPYVHGRGGDVARVLLRAAMAKPWLLGAAAGVLLLVLIAGIWASVLLLGFVGDHGVKGLVEAVLGVGTRLWEGS